VAANGQKEEMEACKAVDLFWVLCDNSNCSHNDYCVFVLTQTNMKPLLHANISRKQHGGNIDDYLPIHNFIDSTKAAMPDVRHRAILHSAFGCFLVEQVFGTYITNSDGKKVSTRDIAEEHIIQDLGFIPTLEKYLNNMQLQQWMSGTERGKHNLGKRHISLED
jgi:hypothetical protein